MRYTVVKIDGTTKNIIWTPQRVKRTLFSYLHSWDNCRDIHTEFAAPLRPTHSCGFRRCYCRRPAQIIRVSLATQPDVGQNGERTLL